MNRNAIVMELMEATPLNRVQEIDRPDKVGPAAAPDDVPVHVLQ